jgi:hypothetical protein
MALFAGGPGPVPRSPQGASFSGRPGKARSPFLAIGYADPVSTLKGSGAAKAEKTSREPPDIRGGLCTWLLRTATVISRPHAGQTA